VNEKEIKALVESIERVLGNPLEADSAEIDALFSEFGDDKNPAKTVFDLAAKAAQNYRLRDQAVPVHVVEALNFTKGVLSGNNPESAAKVIDALMNPFFGPVQQISYAFRNRTENTKHDEELLEKLSRELQKDRSEDNEK
jgi:hypothetical protein